MTKQQTIPVTVRAVVQRIRRKLAKEGTFLVASRMFPGTYNVVTQDKQGKRSIERRNSPQKLADWLCVLKPWESIQ